MPADNDDTDHDDGKPLTLNARAKSPEGKALIAAVFERVRHSPSAMQAYGRGTDRTEKYRLAVEALVSGVLLNAARYGHRVWSGQGLSSGYFTGQAVGKRQFTQAAIPALLRVGLIEKRDAATYFYGGGVERYATRFRVTPPLLALCPDHGFTLPDPPQAAWTAHFHRERPATPPEPIILRTLSKWAGTDKLGGDELPIPEGPAAAAARETVALANAFIARFDITGCDPMVFQRRYTHDLQGQGRWYAPFSSMRREDRKGLRIGGEQVVEVDVRASHLTVLHGHLRLPLPNRDDLYGDLGFPREVVKRWVTGTIGGGKPVQRWSKAMQEEARKSEVELADHRCGDLAHAVLSAYPFLRTLPTTLGCAEEPRLCSIRIMWREACALTMAMDTLRRQDIPALPLHDALIVRERDRGAAADALRRGYQECLGVTPRVK